MSRHCEICNIVPPPGFGGFAVPGDWCTNGRCGACCRTWCTPGGGSRPGHHRRWPANPDVILKALTEARNLLAGLAESEELYDKSTAIEIRQTAQALDAIIAKRRA